ncbi:MAG: YgiQ family radical SAM protein [Oscillospiraceae bacterium]|nr:YgiQ family radical SAM protein [Oscillospiraceae bacterium]
MALVFLPVSCDEMRGRGWYYYDFLLVTGDAYVDHPSFGAAVIGRVLESRGYRVAVLAQPQSSKYFSNMGMPRIAVLVTGGNIDSMVANYTAAKKRRSGDEYSPRDGLRPDRASLVYSRMARTAFGESVKIILGGLEASLRRFAHYDYWDDAVRPSYLIDADADVLVYGMGERAILQLAERIKRKMDYCDIRGICYRSTEYPEGDIAVCEPFETVVRDKFAYCRAFMTQYNEQDAETGRTVVQAHGDELLVQNPPAAPLSESELDTFAGLPYTRAAHPMYKDGIKALEEVKFSITHNRGCFGACNFCSIAFHQGRVVTARSHDSVIEEARSLTEQPDFKGYIHDVGGPTANFRHRACNSKAMCKHRSCLVPEPCPKLNTDSLDYVSLLRKLREIPNIKKVFVRSGLRYDYLLLDKHDLLLSELVKHHISGQLKVAPEHCAPNVLKLMNKPKWEKYLEFESKFDRLNKRYGKKQFVVPYLISSHPGCTLDDAVNLAETLHKMGRHPEQVQDFYPTPGTLSTCMYYTGLNPRNMKPVYVARTQNEKAMQRALLQWKRPDKRKQVIAALHKAGRDDLIGYGKGCLVRPIKKSSKSH